MTKTDLTAHLEVIRQNVTAGLAALAVLSSKEARPLLENGAAQFGNFRVDFYEIALLMREDEKKAAFTAQFVQLLIRTLVREPFDLIVQYCDSSSQSASLKQQDWYRFARFIRDAIARGFRFEFNSFDRGLAMPVVWKDKKITGAHDGQPIELDFFGMFDAWALFTEMKAFAARLA
ncbi:MAG TPA: hypothetical protein VGK48_22075 [Terriglobia bacterium]|jgi:hypothetical protein